MKTSRDPAFVSVFYNIRGFCIDIERRRESCLDDSEIPRLRPVELKPDAIRQLIALRSDPGPERSMVSAEMMRRNAEPVIRAWH
jgi:hypothetical protein